MIFLMRGEKEMAGGARYHIVLGFGNGEKR
jgi:hypothetical protein